jgi:hypothetical protein
MTRCHRVAAARDAIKGEAEPTPFECFEAGCILVMYRMPPPKPEAGPRARVVPNYGLALPGRPHFAALFAGGLQRPSR